MRALLLLVVLVALPLFAPGALAGGTLPGDFIETDGAAGGLLLVTAPDGATYEASGNIAWCLGGFAQVGPVRCFARAELPTGAAADGVWTYTYVPTDVPLGVCVAGINQLQGVDCSSLPAGTGIVPVMTGDFGTSFRIAGWNHYEPQLPLRCPITSPVSWRLDTATRSITSACGLNA